MYKFTLLSSTHNTKVRVLHMKMSKPLYVQIRLITKKTIVVEIYDKIRRHQPKLI